MQECRLFLMNVAAYVCRNASDENTETADSFLTALTPIAAQLLNSPYTEIPTATQREIPFCQMLEVLAVLASAGEGKGHAKLVKIACDWLQSCCKFLGDRDVLNKIECNAPQGKHLLMLESATQLMQYLSEVTSACRPGETGAGATAAATAVAGGPQPSDDVDSDYGMAEIETDWLDDINDDESGDESDGEDLNNKLCTYTITAKEFINQHWYHCHTCEMVDGEGNICVLLLFSTSSVLYSPQQSQPSFLDVSCVHRTRLASIRRVRWTHFLY